MRNYYKSLSPISIIIILSFFLLTLSCSDDPSSPVTEKPIDAVSIGVNGGIIEKDDLSITIPAGSFDGNYDISVSEVEDDGAFGENTISSSYKIVGLPENFKKPIEIKIKNSNDLNNESYIAVGSKHFDELINNSFAVYDLIPASDSAGTLTSNFLPSNEVNFSKENSIRNINADSFEKIIKGITGKNSRGSKYFWVIYPVTLESKVEKIEEIFDSAADIIWNDLGINYNPEQLYLRITRRIIITAQDNIAVTNEFFPEMARSVYNVSRNHVSQSQYSDIKFEAGLSLLDVELQTLYSEAKIEPNIWLNRAIITWAEELFSDVINYKPSYTFNNKVWMAPFNGMQAGAKIGTQGLSEAFWELEHGIGMAPLIKYLVDDERSGKNAIKKLCLDIWENKKSNDALLRVIDAPTKDWWPDFIKKHINGEIYDRSIEYFLNNTSNVWEINNEQDLEYNFNSSDPNIGFYPDLSAKLFKVKLNFSEFDNSQKLLLNMSSLNNNEGLSLIIFSIDKDNNAKYIGTSREAGVEIADLKGYYDLGVNHFLVVLANSNITSENYLGQSDIDLEMQITPKGSGTGSDLNYNRCFIEVYLVADIYDTRYAEEYEHYTSPIRLGTENEYDSEIRSIEGSFSGNTFTGTYIGTGDREGQSSTATIILNDTHDMILEYSWAEVDTSLATLANPIRSVSGVSGVNIPINQTKEGYFELRGANTCSGVSTLLRFTEWEKEQFGTVRFDSSTVEGFSCDENSRVIIEFSEE